MIHPKGHPAITNWLANTRGLYFVLYCMTAAFLTYSSMYAFRKPFTAAMFDGMELWNIDYKIILITSQVLGYMLSKFIGIKYISELKSNTRIRSILVLIGLAWFALFLFGLVPYPYNFILLFFNGLPLGMIWGIVFSFLEGRRYTEMLGAGLCITFILSSGVVKAVGNFLIVNLQINQFWMPFATGLLFVPLLLISVWMMSKIPPPTAADEAHRTRRVPMDKTERRRFFVTFAPGIVAITVIYIALTVIRDLRDNFAVEIWSALGYADQPHVLLVAEIPVALFVVFSIGLMMFIKNNRIGFYSNYFIFILSGTSLLLITFLFQIRVLGPTIWMISIGAALYLAYIAFHTFLLERFIALFRYRSNIGFLMYIVDSFGYLGSVLVLFVKNFGSPGERWLDFIINSSYAAGLIVIAFSIMAAVYFTDKEKRTGRLSPVSIAVGGDQDYGPLNRI